MLDWDGTLVPSMWPEQPMEFNDGAIEAVQKLHHAGMKLVVHSARMNPYDPWTWTRLPPSQPAAQKAYIRRALDAKGLTFVDIWDRAGKPSGSRYVDDKAVKYTGRPGSWKAVTNRILIELGSEEPLFPTFERG